MPNEATVAQGYWPASLSSAKTALIGAYIETCSISKACAAADVPRRTHYHWLATDPIYRDEFLAAKPLVAERLEDEAVRRGFEGVTKPVTIAGEREEIIEYDSGLLKMLLMAHAPERFKQRVEQTNLEKFEIDKMTPEEMDKLAAHLMKKHLGENPEVVAEARRKLEAGEAVTVEGTFQDVTESKE